MIAVKSAIVAQKLILHLLLLRPFGNIAMCSDHENEIFSLDTVLPKKYIGIY